MLVIVTRNTYLKGVAYLASPDPVEIGDGLLLVSMGRAVAVVAAENQAEYNPNAALLPELVSVPDAPGDGKLAVYVTADGLYTLDSEGNVVGPLAPADPMSVATIAADDAITLALAPACHVVTLSEACAVTFPTPVEDYHVFEVRLIEDETGGWAVTWPATVTWAAGTAPTQTTTGGNVSVWVFSTYNGGTSWFGVRVADGVA